MSTLNIVTLNIEYFPDPTRGRPVFNGDIYVGEPDTDPEIPANQKQVTLREEDGTLVSVAQPVNTGAGGVPMYNGSPVQMLVDGDYSLKVLDKLGVQVYYVANSDVDDPVFNDITLDAIDSIVNDAAVTGVFWYDTTLDDNPWWPAMAQHQSWFLDLGEFPKQVIITVEGTDGHVKFYNATQSALPLWLTFNGGSAVNMMRSFTGEHSVKMKNGVLVVGSTSSRCKIINFITDSSRNAGADANNGSYKGNIRQRNDGLGFNADGLVILSNVINYVDITSDGIGNNTIAVYTDGGTSTINPDGTVYDSDSPDKQISGYISNELVSVNQADGSVSIWDSTPQADAVPPDTVLTVSSIPALLGTPTVAEQTETKAIGSSLGLTLANHENDTVSRITTDYCAPNQYDDIKGAWLANSKTADRSVNNNPLVENGTVTESAVATGAELKTYSGFGSSNYLEQAYNADLDFGVGDFYIMGWFEATADNTILLHRTDKSGASFGTGARFYLKHSAGGGLSFNTADTALASTTYNTISTPLVVGQRHFIKIIRKTLGADFYVDGVFIETVLGTVRDVDSPTNVLLVGSSYFTSINGYTGNQALFRIGAGGPNASQADEIYRQEKPLFNENAKCTLQGSSNDVKAIGYSESDNIKAICSGDHITRFNDLIVESDEATIATSISRGCGNKEAIGV